MKNIKPYKLFEAKMSSSRESELNNIGITLDQAQDIFIGIKDCGLEVDDIYTGNSLSMGYKDIITNYLEFGQIGKSYKSFTIRLKSINRHNFYIEKDLYDELKSSIGHIESELGLKLSYLYLRTPDGVWFKNLDSMEKYISNLSLDDISSLQWVSFLDLVFISKSINESNHSAFIDGNYKHQYTLLKSIFDDVKDIFTDIVDDYDIDFDINIGEYHKNIGDIKYLDSINIDLKDNMYNFFRFNDHILHTIKKLRSFLSDYDLNIDIELISENEYHSLDKFIEEYGNDEFHEIGIIIY
jgi:hypothetical protein